MKMKDNYLPSVNQVFFGNPQGLDILIFFGCDTSSNIFDWEIWWFAPRKPISQERSFILILVFNNSPKKPLPSNLNEDNDSKK